jgi:intraflagellar transport protein 172
VADQSGHPQADLLRQQYYQWLLQTAQEDRAGAVKEQEGDFKGAIGLYLKGGLPAKAAQVRGAEQADTRQS